MKSFSRRVKVAIILGIAVVAIFAFKAMAKKPPSIAAAAVKRHWPTARRLKNTDINAFKKLLDDNEAIYCLTFQVNASDPGTALDNGGCTTTSSSSVDAATRDVVLAGGGAHVTQSAGLNTPQQAAAIDAAFY
jgi:hypothetical protein